MVPSPRLCRLTSPALLLQLPQPTPASMLRGGRIYTWCRQFSSPVTRRHWAGLGRVPLAFCCRRGAQPGSFHIPRKCTEKTGGPHCTKQRMRSPGGGTLTLCSRPWISSSQAQSLNKHVFGVQIWGDMIPVFILKSKHLGIFSQVRSR